MKRSRQVVLVITSTVVLAACDRAREPLPPPVVTADRTSEPAAVGEPAPAGQPVAGVGTVARGTNSSAPGGTVTRTHFYPWYHPGAYFGSRSGVRPTPADSSSGLHSGGSTRPSHSAPSPSHSSPSRSGFGSHGSSSS